MTTAIAVLVLIGLVAWFGYDLDDEEIQVP